jgi:hypothetical protein
VHAILQAFMGYSVSAAMSSKTPAYTELASNILENIFQRMIDPRVWNYWNTDTVRDFSFNLVVLCFARSEWT